MSSTGWFVLDRHIDAPDGDVRPHPDTAGPFHPVVDGFSAAVRARSLVPTP
ncbi:hypothetical protein ACWEFJ_18795 [Actinosynnema sp. NPDC004786]